MVCKARLSWRSPERFSRCRVTCPDEAGIGLTPARAAKAASERRRPACDQLTRIWAALIGPTPGSSSRQGVTAATSRSSSARSSAASPASSWMRWAVDLSAQTVMRCSSDLAGRSRSLAQRAICRLVPSPRSSVRSSSGAPTISALSWLMAQTLATHALWRVASSTRSASRSPRRRGASTWSWANASRAARMASNASLLAPVRRGGRLGRPTSTTCSPCARRNTASPAP
jgi:hypothetical protein